MGVRGPILAATGLSESADASLREGYAIATHIRAPFIVCHVVPEAFQVRVLFPPETETDSTRQTTIQEQATAAVHQRFEAVLGRPRGEMQVEIESGTAHAGILAVAERVGAGLIALGPGPTAQRVARSAACPVLIARPSPASGSVLGATDFSDPALPAIEMAAAEAKRRGAKLRLIHCLDIDATAYLSASGLAGMIVVPPMMESAIRDMESSAADRLRKALAQTGAAGETTVERRQPIAGILDAARTVATALVVVGTHGRTGFSRMALGSVAEEVLTQASCSVMVVRLHSARNQERP